jgi:hypothetical protein
MLQRAHRRHRLETLVERRRAHVGRSGHLLDGNRLLEMRVYPGHGLGNPMHSGLRLANLRDPRPDRRAQQPNYDLVDHERSEKRRVLGPSHRIEQSRHGLDDAGCPRPACRRLEAPMRSNRSPCCRANTRCGGETQNGRFSPLSRSWASVSCPSARLGRAFSRDRSTRRRRSTRRTSGTSFRGSPKKIAKPNFPFVYAAVRRLSVRHCSPQVDRFHPSGRDAAGPAGSQAQRNVRPTPK